MSELRPETKIIAFTGLPGAGKSEAVNYLTGKGHPKVYFGGVILNAMKEAGLEWNEANEKQFREEIREREGKDFVAQRIISELHGLIDAGQKRIVADGLYSWTEYKLLKHEFPGELTVVAIVAPKHLRHHRLTIRPQRPLTIEEANERDWSEIEHLEKGGPIAIADHYISNEGDLDTLHARIDTLLDDIKF
jgi:dephospho-CoA kinase